MLEVDKEGVVVMLITSQIKPDDMVSTAGNKGEGFVLTISEIAHRLGVSEHAARALLEASLRRSIRDEV